MFMIKSESNKIESIEGLQFMNMPFIESLNLCKTIDKTGGNNITNVNALNKCGWNYLQYFYLCSYLSYDKRIT